MKSSPCQLGHRGPDFQSLKDFESFSAYHSRLSIIDLSDGSNQPLMTEKSLLLFNGEIYNYKSLAKKYLHNADAKSDSITLQLLIEKKGRGILNELRGMFAFVWLDFTNNELLAARDHVGQKPLYFFKNENQIFFSSRASHLAELTDYQIRTEGLWEYEILQSSVQKETLFKGIEELDPGSFLEFSKYKFQIKKYWDPPSRHKKLDNDWEEQICSLLQSATQECLVADVPIATSLSGGIDSSIVAAVASQFSDSIEAYHGYFNDFGNFNESSHAIEQAKFLGIQLNLVELGALQFDSDFIDALWHLDLPQAGPGLVNQYRIAGVASKNHKILLGGQGGDEFFAGYARYFLQDAEDKTGILKGYENLAKKFNPKYNSLQNYLKIMNRSKLTFDLNDKRFEYVYTCLEEKIFANNLNPSSPYIDIALLLDQQIILPCLLHIEDTTGMAFGLEGRMPLLDKDLIEFSLALDTSELIRFGPKGLLRSNRFLAPSVAKRTDKMGFPLPLSDWISNKAVPTFLKLLGNNTTLSENLRNAWGIVSLNLFLSRNSNGIVQL